MDTETVNDTPSQAQLGALLSAVTYRGQDLINQLRKTDMNAALRATTDGWQIVWGPVTSGENLMFLAQQGSSNQYALAVRGTLVTRIENVIEDLDVTTMVAPGFGLDSRFGDALVSQGVQTAWSNLSTVTPGLDLGDGTVLDRLGSIAGDFSLLITGHSLGGQTATVLAAWLQQALGSSAQVSLVTMAAPTAGNADFASGIDQVFGSTATTGYFNAIDAVPMLWASLPGIEQLFEGGPSCGALCKQAVDSMQTKLDDAGLSYVQPTTRQSLPGQLYSVGSLGSFEKEILDQHSAQYYMFLLQWPLLIVQTAGVDSSWAPPP